jgi:hypothetical protein
MLPAMIRMALIVLLLSSCSSCTGCSKKSTTTQDKPAPAPTTPIAASDKGADQAAKPAAPLASADDPQFHLKPEEGTLTVDKAQGKAGAETTATIKVDPAAGYHVSMEYPIKLALQAPDGVTLAKTEYKAGGASKSAGDAAAYSEKELAFAVKATPARPGTYEIKGVLKFGVCDKDSCHPKKQPITIQVAAN